MKILRYTDSDFELQLDELLKTSSLFDPTVEERARHIIEAVATRGDEALLELTQNFDGASLTAAQLAVTTSEKFNASLKAQEALRSAVAMAHRFFLWFCCWSLRFFWLG